MVNDAPKISAPTSPLEGEAFDAVAWRTRCESMADDAGRRCALSDTLYVRIFSISVDAAICELPFDVREVALTVAREYGYETPKERSEDAQRDAENGYCSHGLDLDCCPAGCGEGGDV